MAIPPDCSWKWRGVLKHRKHSRKYIRYIIEGGEETIYWHDLWLGDTPLVKDQIARQDLHILVDAKFADLITYYEWNSTEIYMLTHRLNGTPYKSK